MKTRDRSQPRIVSSFFRKMLNWLFAPPFSHKAVSFLPACSISGRYILHFPAQHDLEQKREREAAGRPRSLVASITGRYCNSAKTTLPDKLKTRGETRSYSACIAFNSYLNLDLYMYLLHIYTYQTELPYRWHFQLCHI